MNVIEAIKKLYEETDEDNTGREITVVIPEGSNVSSAISDMRKIGLLDIRSHKVNGCFGGQSVSGTIIKAVTPKHYKDKLLAKCENLTLF